MRRAGRAVVDETPRAPTFGVEEEYLLLDAATGLPADAAVDLIDDLDGLRAEHEFFHSQLETATPVCSEAADALDSLAEFRAAASAAAERRGLVLAGTGLPPIGGEIRGTVTAKDRYQQIAGRMRGMVHRYYSTGTHVHVAVPSRDAGIDAISRIAPWSPVLVALTANSPLWLGDDSGYASWRYLSIQQWPTSGFPPRFADAAEYDRVVGELVRTGALVDAALVNWSIRLSDRFPTIEIRTADAQLGHVDAVAFGLLFRALVTRALREGAAGAPIAPVQPDVLRGAHWLAARNGLGDTLADPATGEPVPAFDGVGALLAHVADDLLASGDHGIVTDWIERRRADGGAAELQRSAWASGGIAGLLELFRTSSRA